MKYKYEGNLNPANSTTQIILEVDVAGKPTKILELRGEAEELSYTQYLHLKDIFVLTPVEEEPPYVAPVSNATEVVKSEIPSVVKATDRA